MSIEDGIKVGDSVKVTIVGYVGDSFSGSPDQQAPGRYIRLDYGHESAYIACEQPGATVTKA